MELVILKLHIWALGLSFCFCQHPSDAGFSSTKTKNTVSLDISMPQWRLSHMLPIEICLEGSKLMGPKFQLAGLLLVFSGTNPSGHPSPEIAPYRTISWSSSFQCQGLMSDSVPYPVTSVQHSCLLSMTQVQDCCLNPHYHTAQLHEIGLPCVNKNIWTFNGSHPIIQSRILAKPNFYVASLVSNHHRPAKWNQTWSSQVTVKTSAKVPWTKTKVCTLSPQPTGQPQNANYERHWCWQQISINSGHGTTFLKLRLPHQVIK